MIGTAVAELDTPQALLDLDVVDANVKTLFAEAKNRGVAVRVHFKSLKCAGLAKHLMGLGAQRFLCAKLNEAEILADAGVYDILLANQIARPQKGPRLAALAERCDLKVCVDHPDQVALLGEAMKASAGILGVLVEVDVGMARCGVAPGQAAVDLAQLVQRTPKLRFDGLQGYDGHLQLNEDFKQKRLLCHEGLRQLVDTREAIEAAGLPVGLVTGAGTGTWEYVAGYPGVTEIQPGSFVLMDCIYHGVRPEFGCALSILTTVQSIRNGWCVLDAGSKAISKDFGMPTILGRPAEKVVRLAEEHTKVEADVAGLRVGEYRQVVPAHCCATMNLHRRCLAVRKGVVVADWPIEASGRYD